MGIYYIYNGNHSTNAGIVNSDGTIQVEEYLDISYLYDEYKFDGEYLSNINNSHERIPLLFELGVLFEIGRLLLERKELIIQKHDFKDSY